MKYPAKTWVASLLPLLVVLFACGDEQGDDATETDNISYAGGYLAEGRTVQILPANSSGRLETVDPRAIAPSVKWTPSFNGYKDSWLDLIAASCDFQARSVYGNSGESRGDTSLKACPGGDCTNPATLDPNGIFAGTPSPVPANAIPASDENAPIRNWTTKYSTKPYVTQGLMLCAGERLMEMAKSLVPTVFRGRETTAGSNQYDWIVAGYGNADWPQSWKDHERLLRNSATTNNRQFALPDLSKFKVLFTVPPPSADEATTWALLAIDFFRESAIVGAHGLAAFSAQTIPNQCDTPPCPSRALQWTAQLADGSLLSHEQMMLGNVASALQSMQDAAEFAERYAGAPNPKFPDNSPEAVWRERLRSRLEAARTFSAVPATAFDGHGMLPLYLMAHGTSGELVETTDSSAVLARWGTTVKSSTTVMGYIYSASLPPPSGALPVYLYEKYDSNRSALVDVVLASTTAANSKLAGYTKGAIQGYVMPLAAGMTSCPSGLLADPLRLVANGTGSNITYRAQVDRNATNEPIGCMYREELKANNYSTPSIPGRFPIVTSDAQSQSNLDRIAEKKLRQLRVSPICLAGHPYCPESLDPPTTVPSPRYTKSYNGRSLPSACYCNAYGEIDVQRIMLDMYEVENDPKRFNNQAEWEQTQPYLWRGPIFTTEYLEIAAKRIAQQSAVLGHAIEPLGVVVQKLATSVVMVSGTQKDYRPVEPAFLQAQTDGAARQFVVDPEDGNATGQGLSDPVNPRLVPSFARRGIYHAALYARKTLAHYAPNTAAAGTFTKLNKWLDETVDGWMRVEFSIGASSKNGLLDINLSVTERETVDSNGTYELWKGEAGLECATTGAVSGLNCIEADYRIGASDPVAAFRVAAGTWRVPNIGFSDRRYRVYITKNVGRTRRALGGVTVPSVRGTEVTAIPILGASLNNAYSRTLAADPTASNRAHQYCGDLIDYDVRIKLSDEITRARGQSGELSDSLEYYLGRAETAATRADTLGNEIIEYGLQMDLRAEQGLEELETLCGVSADANPLGDDNLTVTSGQSGLNACTASPADLVWASAGTIPHCMWRLTTDPKKQLGPCDCGGDETCEKKKREAGQCPRLLASANADCNSTVFADKLSGVAGIKYEKLELLGYSVEQSTQGEAPLTDVPAERPSGYDIPEITGRCDMLAALFAGEYQNKTLGEVREAFPWIDFDEIRSVATAIGWSMDPYGRVTLTLNGEPWRPVGSFAPEAHPGIEDPKRPPELLAEVKKHADRTKWEPVGNQRWPVTKGCKIAKDDGAPVADLLACSGTDNNGTHAWITDASRVYEGLTALERLTGAAGPRQGWSSLWDPDLTFYIANEKRYARETEAITQAPLRSLFPDEGTNYVYWANVDDEEYFVTQFSKGFNDWGEVMDTVFGGDRPEWMREPWNWYRGAAFRKESTEAEIDDEFQADEFSNVSTIWKVLRTPKDGTHTVVSKPKLSGFWRMFFGDGDEWALKTALPRRQLFDALSLVCMAKDSLSGVRPSADSCSGYFTDPPTMVGAANGADCVAEHLANVVNQLYIPGVPRSVFDTLKANGTVQVLPDFSGQYAETVSTLGAELGVYRSTTQAVARAVNELGYHTRTVLRTIEQIENELKVQDLTLKKDIANQITACVAAVAQNGGLADTITNFGSNQAGVAAVCANSVAQGIWSTQINELKKKNLNIDQDQALDNFQEKIHDVMARVDEQIEELRRSQAAVHAHIAALDSIRRKASRAKSRATLSLDAGQGRVNHVNAVMRARMNTTLNRYDRAFDQAVRYGYLARRAIEERIGMPLDEITKKSSLSGDKGTGGEAPYQWAEQICSMKGIDYQDIAGHAAGADGKLPEENQTYAGSYIGDYIVQLRDFLDAYRFDYPFQDGSDTVVVSLRDELQGIRKMGCALEGPNVLLDTRTPSSSAGAWRCHAPVVGSSGGPSNCPTFAPEPSDPGPFNCAAGSCTREQAAAKVSRLVLPDNNVSAIVQTVKLVPGAYTLSWWERCSLNGKAVTAPLSAVRVAARGASTPTDLSVPCDCTATTGCLAKKESGKQIEWIQRAVTVTAENEGPYDIGFVFPKVASPVSSPVSARLAAIQLERGPATGFFPTGEDTSAPYGICEDTTGQGFRSWDNWTYRCETYCPAGTGNNCTQLFAEETLSKACYYETRFSISQELIERGRQVTQAGFARGNFNYRIEDLAFNFVGTGLRKCEGAELQSACYGGSFLQYSLEHVGPYRVRNHDGDLYASRIYPGRVQQGKGLAAERYFTNPLSGADRTLVSDYMRSEMRGRPLDGTYILRVYDNEALQWNRLEDIQLLLKYQYWTHLD